MCEACCGWQYMNGQTGDDTYRYAKSAGLVYIGSSAESASSGSADRIVFSDLNVEDFIFGELDYSQFSYGGDQVALRMMWSDGATSGEMRIAHMGEHIESFEFANGTVMDADYFLI